MNQIVKNLGLGLAGKLIDFGVAKLTGPHKTTPEQRIEQINRTLEMLESVPEVGQPPARPPIEAPLSQNKAVSASVATITTQDAESAAEKEDVATACVACAVGHFSTSAGLLNEAVRFKKDGITSNEIVDRIAKVLEEQNTLERVDLTPEKIRSSPEWERDIAEEALQQSRSLRHALETIESIDDLERAAADTAAYYRKLNRTWWKGRFANLGSDKAELIADKVGQLGPEVPAFSQATRGSNPGAKEPWQMTREEYVRLFEGKPQFVEKGMQPSDVHEYLVTLALSEGKSVPHEVLADYPDLVKGAK